MLNEEAAVEFGMNCCIYYLTYSKRASSPLEMISVELRAQAANAEMLIRSIGVSAQSNLQRSKSILSTIIGCSSHVSVKVSIIIHQSLDLGERRLDPVWPECCTRLL